MCIVRNRMTGINQVLVLVIKMYGLIVYFTQNVYRVHVHKFLAGTRTG